MVDRDLILRKLSNLDTYLTQLARLDAAIVLRVLQTDVQDLERFRAAVLSLL